MSTKILIIDDESDITRAVRLTVSIFQPDWTVIEANNANSGRVKFLTTHPDLVLLDISMPDMDGLELLRQIRRISKTPVIILSAKDESTYKPKAMAFGANDFLPKPIDPPLFIDSIKHQLALAHQMIS